MLLRKGSRGEKRRVMDEFSSLRSATKNPVGWYLEGVAIFRKAAPLAFTAPKGRSGKRGDLRPPPSTGRSATQGAGWREWGEGTRVVSAEESAAAAQRHTAGRGGIQGARGWCHFRNKSGTILPASVTTMRRGRGRGEGGRGRHRGRVLRRGGWPPSGCASGLGGAGGGGGG